jgi:hypothetical protein
MLDGLREGSDFAFKLTGAVVGGLSLIAAALDLWLKYR